MPAGIAAGAAALQLRRRLGGPHKPAGSAAVPCPRAARAASHGGRVLPVTTGPGRTVHPYFLLNPRCLCRRVFSNSDWQDPHEAAQRSAEDGRAWRPALGALPQQAWSSALRDPSWAPHPGAAAGPRRPPGQLLLPLARRGRAGSGRGRPCRSGGAGLGIESAATAAARGTPRGSRTNREHALDAGPGTGKGGKRGAFHLLSGCFPSRSSLVTLSSRASLLDASR
jgi:hypothetical protein